jgi:hypothetical protein
MDGEAVWAGKDGKSDFDRLHSNAHDDAVFLYAFDLLELNSEDYRNHPLEKRKKNFWLGLMGCDSRNTSMEMARRFSSKPAKWDWRASSRSRGISRIGQVGAKSWLKIKNPESAAVLRIEEGSW